MKEASGELSLTVVAVVGIGLVLAFVTGFLPRIFDAVEGKIGEQINYEIPTE